MTDGPLMFVRYAYPPNELGYCGPPDSDAFRDSARSGELVKLARTFTGAWPYLELLAAAGHIEDPLDHRVVEAYWVGNDMLRGVPLPAGGLPHHSFHVFCVYPWAALLPDARKAERALAVLDRCRIRWGRVTAVDGEQVAVTFRPLRWDGQVLSLGQPARETARLWTGAAVGPGDWVSLHWEWVCDRLSPRQLAALRTYTRFHLDLLNRKSPLSERRWFYTLHDFSVLCSRVMRCCTASAPPLPSLSLGSSSASCPPSLSRAAHSGSPSPGSTGSARGAAICTCGPGSR